MVWNWTIAPSRALLWRRTGGNWLKLSEWRESEVPCKVVFSPPSVGRSEYSKVEYLSGQHAESSKILNINGFGNYVETLKKSNNNINRIPHANSHVRLNKFGLKDLDASQPWLSHNDWNVACLPSITRQWDICVWFRAGLQIQCHAERENGANIAMRPSAEWDKRMWTRGCQRRSPYRFRSRLRRCVCNSAGAGIWTKYWTMGCSYSIQGCRATMNI